MKHPFYILAILVIACLLGFACAPNRHVMILTPDFGDELEMDNAEMPGLEGTWILDPTGEVWTFTCEGSGRTLGNKKACSEDIELTIDEKESLDVDLFVLGTSNVMVIKGEETDGLFMLPLSSMLLIKENREGMGLRELDPEWLEKSIEKDPGEIAVKTTKDNTVLVGGMEDVYRFIREHSEDAAAFRTYGVLKRLEGGSP
jgi:hypothetical protein